MHIPNRFSFATPLFQVGFVGLLLLLSSCATGTSTSTVEPTPACDCLGSPPGEFISMASMDPLPPIPPGGSIKIAVLFQTGDALRMTVSDATSVGLHPTNQMEVGLASEVDWEKRIFFWSRCRRSGQSLRQNGKTEIPTVMVLEKGCASNETIAFWKKSGFLALSETDVGYLEKDRFWKLLAGKRVIFTWVKD
jgi:hypothetical protein